MHALEKVVRNEGASGSFSNRLDLDSPIGQDVHQLDLFGVGGVPEDQLGVPVDPTLPVLQDLPTARGRGGSGLFLLFLAQKGMQILGQVHSQSLRQSLILVGILGGGDTIVRKAGRGPALIGTTGWDRWCVGKVDPDSNQKPAVRGGFDQDTRDLASIDQDVVGPFEGDGGGLDFDLARTGIQEALDPLGDQASNL